jgi:hypothetical protein
VPTPPSRRRERAERADGGDDRPAGRFAALADPQGAPFAVFEGDFDD